MKKLVDLVVEMNKMSDELKELELMRESKEELDYYNIYWYEREIDKIEDEIFGGLW